MSKIVVADSTCLIALSKINKINILELLFKTIYIPKAVYDEVVTKGNGRPGCNEIKGVNWIVTEPIKDSLAVNVLRLQLGAGESEAIILAKEIKANFIILDDWRARQAALGLELPVVGTVALLTKAVEKGFLSDIKTELDSLKAAGFYFAVQK